MLQLFDKVKNAALENKTMPLKGELKVVFIDPRDGSEHVEAESHNIVTNAFSSIFAANWLNCEDFYSLLPGWQLFGGIFCFSEQLTADASNMWPVNENVARMTANAGQTSHSTASPTRGNPNGDATEISGNHIKLAWDWAINQGNGTIKCCCLTHSLAGDSGLLPDGSMQLVKTTGPSIDSFNRFAANIMPDNSYTRDIAITMPVSVNNDGQGVALYFSGTELEEITVAHSYVTANLLEPAALWPATNYRELSTRTATLSRTFTAGYTQLAQDASNYYVIERDSENNKKLYVDVVSKTDMSVTAKTITITDDSITLACSNVTGARLYSGIVSNGSVYIVSGSDAKKFVRVNINNAADVEELASTLSANINLGQSAFNMSDNMVLGKNFLINGDTVYPVAGRSNRANENLQYMDVLARYGNGPHVFQRGNTGDNYVLNAHASGGMIVLPYLATVCNISEVTKPANKAMRIEYTLTEA